MLSIASRFREGHFSGRRAQAGDRPLRRSQGLSGASGRPDPEDARALLDAVLTRMMEAPRTPRPLARPLWRYGAGPGPGDEREGKNDEIRDTLMLWFNTDGVMEK